MKKNLYYRTVLRRKNVIKEAIFDLFFDFCSYPKLLLEVFIKQDFGERYFSFSSAILMAIVLLFVPIPVYSISRYFSNSESSLNGFAYFTAYFLSWYAFLGLFVFISAKRRAEIKRNPSVFDFEKFSLNTGFPTKLFQKILKLHGHTDPRSQELSTEPLFFFLVSIALIILGQYLGYLVCFSSLFYWLRNKAAYYRGDNFIIDKIDEFIMNEQMVDAFVHGVRPEKTKGVEFHARKPSSEKLRRKLADSLVEEGKEDVAFVR